MLFIGPNLLTQTVQRTALLGQSRQAGLGPTARDPNAGVDGDFGIIGSDVLARIFFGRQVFSSRRRGFAILAGARSIPPGLDGDYGLIGLEVGSKMTGGNRLLAAGHRRFAIVQGSETELSSAQFNITADATVYETRILANQEVVGEFAMLGTRILNGMFPSGRGIFVSRANTRYALIRSPGEDSTVEGPTLLTLDWVKDAQPFVWVATSLPTLLSLDWAQDGEPFAANDPNYEVTSSITLSIVASADLTSTNGDFVTSGANLWIWADATLYAPEVDETSATLNIFADLNLGPSGVVFSTAALNIFADTSFTWIVPLDSTCNLSIIADLSCTNFVAITTGAGLFINADASLAETKFTSQLTLVLPIEADSQILNSITRKVWPCEIPGPILHLASNLPFGVWQEDSDAIFTWAMAFTCNRNYPGKKVPVDGFLISFDQVPETVLDWGADRIHVSHDEFNLSTIPPYGAGSYWFHVAAYNGVGVGPTASYNVCYNFQPTEGGATYMRIDGVDTISHRPLIAYAPVSPHVFTWSLSTDQDPLDTVTYELEIANKIDFVFNPATGSSEIVLQTDSLPMGSYILTQSLKPGVYFWRIRAFDGHEYGNWSPMGSFRVNNPPNAPTDLTIYKTG